MYEEKLTLLKKQSIEKREREREIEKEKKEKEANDKNKSPEKKGLF